MIFSKFKCLAAFFAALLLVSSCAQEPSTSWEEDELRVLNATQKTFFPNATPLGGYTDGSLWLISHAQLGAGNTPKNGDYVAFEYTGRMLPISGGRVFQTTDSTLSRLLGTFKYDTHFAPMFTCDTPTVLQPALVEALKIMHVGDTVKVMSASWLAYGASAVAALNGETSLAANTPVIFTVVLKEIVSDPKQRELDMVNSFVSSHPGFVPARDSGGEVLPGFYISYADTVPLDTAHYYAATGDSVFVKYAGYYLQDNFLLDANIDTIAQKYGWDTSDTTKYKVELPYVFAEDASNEAAIKAFHFAVLNVAPGSWLEFVFISDYGYGAVGNSDTPTRMVYPYTPLRFKVLIKKIN